MSWSKAEATDEHPVHRSHAEVSHAPMSSLKDDAPRNKSAMSVTPPVAHVEMWPVVPLALRSANQAATAVRMLLSSMT